jgi:hypothetical protein
VPAWRASDCFLLVAICDLIFFIIGGCLVISVDVDGRWQLLVGHWLVDLNENLNARILVVSVDDIDDLNVSYWLVVDGCVDMGE